MRRVSLNKNQLEDEDKPLLESQECLPRSLSADSKYAPRDGTYRQEKHAVHGEGGVAGVEGKPARKRNGIVGIFC